MHCSSTSCRSRRRSRFPTSSANRKRRPRRQSPLASLTTGGITSRHSASIAQGSVLSQNPAGGSSAAPGAPVSFVVSLGPPPVGIVPNVVGLTQTSAQQDVQAAGYASAASGQSSATIAAGIVIGQSPAGGTTAPTATPVSLVVSLGPPPGELDLDLDGFTGNQGDCNDTNPAINPGVVDLPGDGIDQNCNGMDSIAGDITFPIASIQTPAEDAEITMPTDIVGTATDANFLRYRLLIASVDETTSFVEIGRRHDAGDVSCAWPARSDVARERHVSRAAARRGRERSDLVRGAGLPVRRRSQSRCARLVVRRPAGAVVGNTHHASSAATTAESRPKETSESAGASR